MDLDTKTLQLQVFKKYADKCNFTNCMTSLSYGWDCAGQEED